MSKFLYAIHDIEAAHIVGNKGWAIATEAIGADPNNHQGVDYSNIAHGATVICRLNYSYGSGTIPVPSLYNDFAIRCANFVASSKGCSRWIIANEMNHRQERAGDQPILPEQYALCFAKCKQAIQIIPGHENDEVIVGAVAPWNIDTGDWLWYFNMVLFEIQKYVDIDSISLHTYTHGSDPSLIISDATMNEPYNDRYYHFWAYKNFMQRIPQSLRHVPVYITETDQDDEWLNENNGWVQAAYDEINRYNSENEQKVRCLALYRWQYDKYAIKDKDAVIDAFKEAQDKNYTWEIEGGNVIQDGFEGGFYAYDGVGEMTCPTDWKPRWNQGTEDGILVRPEYKPAGEAQVRTGDGAAAIHSRFATIDGVLLRKFSVQTNSPIRAAVWMLKVAKESGHGMQIGIHPFGGENFLDDSVVWSEWFSQYSPDYPSDTDEDKWRQRTVQTTAKADTITVFLRSKVDVKADGSNAHFDDFVLEGGDSPEPPIPPIPGDGLQAYIDALNADIAQMQADVDALESKIRTGAILALPV